MAKAAEEKEAADKKKEEENSELSRDTTDEETKDDATEPNEFKDQRLLLLNFDSDTIEQQKQMRTKTSMHNHRTKQISNLSKCIKSKPDLKSKS